MRYRTQLALVVFLLLAGCGVPKELLDKMASDRKVMIDFPLDYYLLLPRLEYDKWDKDYNAFNKFLTRDILKTQLWMGYTQNGVDIAMCPNSARTHVQLDTVSIASDKKLVQGEWRAISNRRIMFIDSAVYADKEIYRKSRVLYDEKDADVLLVLTDTKLTVYGTEKGSSRYKRVPARNYSIEGGRFLLGYGLAKAGGGVSFVGIDTEGRLILSWQAVEERKVKGKYITYQATMTQLILIKM